MSKFNTLIEQIQQLSENNITRTSEKEISYYMEEVFGGLATNLEFIQVDPKDFISLKKNNNVDINNHPKFDNIKFNFVYNNKQFVKVHSGAGANAAKREDGSLSVTAFVYDYDLTTQQPTSRSYTNKISNAFFNQELKDVDYDPVLRTGEQVLEFIKRGLSDDGGEDEETPMPQPTPTNSQKVKKKQYAYA